MHEDFIGLHSTDSIASNSLVSIIRDVLLKLNLNIEIVGGNAMMEQQT